MKRHSTNWYDASGRRVAKQEVTGGQTKRLYLCDSWDVFGVMNENGQVLETFTRGLGLVGDIGTLVAVTHHTASFTNGTFYVHGNHRGDVVLTRNGTATVGTYAYSGFGILNSVSGADVSRFKFSSKERDASTGFSYYGYRFYAPLWQRWSNRDPLEDKDGENPYRFVQNNSVNAVDQLGLFGIPPGQGISIPPNIPGTDDLKLAVQKYNNACTCGDTPREVDCHTICDAFYGNIAPTLVATCWLSCDKCDLGTFLGKHPVKAKKKKKS